MAFLNELRWFIFLHQAYSPDLAPSNFLLFSHHKYVLSGQHFVNDLQVKQATANFFCDCPTSCYAMGIEHLVSQYEKWLNSNSDYVEN